ncbi:hypothetical protein [Streptomyces sp. NPDC001750]
MREVAGVGCGCRRFVQRMNPPFFSRQSQAYAATALHQESV